MANGQNENQATMKNVGIGLMVLSALSALDAIIACVLPNTAAQGLLTGTVNGAAVDAITMVYVVSGISLVLNAIEFYFGYIAFKLRPIKPAAIICLVVGILLVLGFASIVPGGIKFADLSLLVSGLLGIFYYVFYKRTVQG